MIRVLITGPESSGKTQLSKALSNHYNGTWIPEYSREYVKSLDKPYTYEDLEYIALRQMGEYKNSGKEAGLVFFDTWLLITKVWFMVVFKRYPDWITEAIRNARFDLVLLCAPDIPWISDPVRENGGEKREELFSMYRKELDQNSFQWETVFGSGEDRLSSAIRIIEKRVDYAL